MNKTPGLPVVSQLIVIGRGMSDENKLSPASYDRAQAANTYCEQFPDVEQVLFSSGYSSLVDNPSGRSEASIMAQVADIPTDIDVVIEEKSRNTLENFLYSAEYLRPDLTVGVLAHQAHLARALYVAKKVLGNSVVGISAELLGARPESITSFMLEQMQLAWMKSLLHNVQVGDEAALWRYNEIDQRIKGFVGSGLKKAIRMLKLRMPQQYQ